MSNLAVAASLHAGQLAQVTGPRQDRLTITEGVRQLHEVANEALSRARGIASTVRGPIPMPSQPECPPRMGFDLGDSLSDPYSTLAALNGQLVEVQQRLGEA